MKKLFFFLIAASAAPSATLAQYVPISERGSFGLPESANGLPGVVFAVLLLITQIIATLAIIMIVVAGIIYMTSSGDENRAASAKRALTQAVIGLVIALLGWTIVAAVITAFGAG